MPVLRLTDRARAVYAPVDVPRKTLSKYVGTYGKYCVELRDSVLTVLSNRDERIRWSLVPISDALFGIENDQYNIRFDVDASGRAVSLVFFHWKEDGETTIRRTDG